MIKPPHPANRLDALAGMISPVGRDCDFLAIANMQWAESQWSADGEPIVNGTQLADRFRQLTGHDANRIATCVACDCIESVLERAWLLCRGHHQRAINAATSSDETNANSRCLAAVDSEHGRGIIGRMATGRADLRGPTWPLVPGFTHASLESLAQRVDENTAMVLISPLNLNDRMQPITRDQLAGIRAACDRHHACLVIDHRFLPPMGGGHFWLHDSIVAVESDIVMMSAGLTGGAAGGVLTLNAALAQQLDSPNQFVHRDGVVDDAGLSGDMLPNSWVAAIVAATLDQWIAQSWRGADVDDFATALAQRLARRESVRDLVVTGRSIGIELDLPAKLWQEVAADHQLRVSTAGEYAIAMQPPLVLGSDAQSELLNRIDSVFDFVEASELQPESEPVSDEETRADPPVEDDSEYDVVSDESGEFVEDEYEEDESDQDESDDEEVDDEHEAEEKLTHQASAIDSADTDPDDAASDTDPETQT